MGIVRLSGPASIEIAANICSGTMPAPRHAAFRRFLDAQGEAIDEGILLVFPAPHSFTGEDVVEFQGHGGPVVLDLIVQRCVTLGARVARPGEFSERAFLNDKIDLAQAEAIADLIDSGSEKAARSAFKSLQGEFSRTISSLRDKLIDVRMHIEAALDFPEEEIDFLADRNLQEKLSGVATEVAATLRQAQCGSLLREGLHLVIVGKPNAGKSSLLNRLAGRDAAIVTQVPGTTRDILREYIQLDGLPLHIIDTAGLRKSDDPVEREGIKRTWKAVEQADLCLLLIDDTLGFDDQDQQILDQLPDGLPVIEVYNKCDVSGRAPGRFNDKIRLSAKTGVGLHELESTLKQRAGYQGDAEGVIMARRRHVEALQAAASAVTEAQRELRENRAGELVAEHLRMAQQSLGSITGEFTADDLLGEIFSSFCIGK